MMPKKQERRLKQLLTLELIRLLKSKQNMPEKPHSTSLMLMDSEELTPFVIIHHLMLMAL
jgi:hypothetical protein